ncbi:Uncharacterized protein Rs2_08809 [Raphanus sativus]|nr:Uncharacterized protein Rs2_08809 [Raphanus sativus]
MSPLEFVLDRSWSKPSRGSNNQQQHNNKIASPLPPVCSPNRNTSLRDVLSFDAAVMRLQSTRLLHGTTGGVLVIIIKRYRRELLIRDQRECDQTRNRRRVQVVRRERWWRSRVLGVEDEHTSKGRRVSFNVDRSTITTLGYDDEGADDEWR